MKPLFFFLLLILFSCTPEEVEPPLPGCDRELMFTNWVDDTGDDCFIPIEMYKYIDGQLTYITSFENDIPQLLNVAYGDTCVWNLSFCDNSEECVQMTLKEPGCNEQIEFSFWACPNGNKLIIDKVLFDYGGHAVCDNCPD